MLLFLFLFLFLTAVTDDFVGYRLRCVALFGRLLAEYGRRISWRKGLASKSVNELISLLRFSQDKAAQRVLDLLCYDEAPVAGPLAGYCLPLLSSSVIACS